MPDSAPQQLLHLVIGGELIDLEHNTFKDLDQVEVVGVYRPPMSPGRPRRSRPSTTRICAISSCTCTACWIPRKTRNKTRNPAIEKSAS
jgi:hypothetical protein